MMSQKPKKNHRKSNKTPKKESADALLFLRGYKCGLVSYVIGICVSVMCDVRDARSLINFLKNWESLTSYYCFLRVCFAPFLSAMLKPIKVTEYIKMEFRVLERFFSSNAIFNG